MTTEVQELTECAAVLTACDPNRQAHCISNPDWINPDTVVEEEEGAEAEGEAPAEEETAARL